MAIVQNIVKGPGLWIQEVPRGVTVRELPKMIKDM